MWMTRSPHKDSAKTERHNLRLYGGAPSDRRRGEEIRAERTWPVNSPSDTAFVERAARSTGDGNLVNEIADVSFDLVARQTIARLGVR